MTTSEPDGDLVSAYVAQGSETAFRALVARHVDLVYATALRQVGDSGVAEEVTQNVFLALARKAPRLGGIETLAGWLHRTASLEAKARIRAELRRRRRETIAAERVAIEHQGESVIDQVLPLMDEALLHLRDGDRAALVLRFLENRSLREVGEALGIGEDTARKRVARALERVSTFFRQRGFTAGGAGGVAAWLGQSAQAAPAGLAVSAAQAGLGSGSAATGIALALFKLMALTKTQTAIVCAVIAAAPLIWQRQAEAGLSRRHTVISAQAAEARRSLMALDNSLTRARDELGRVQTQTLNAEQQLALLENRRAGRTPAPEYKWDDSLPLARVPKALLQQIDLPAMENKRGELTEQIKEVLQMNPAEVVSVQAAVDRFMMEYQNAAAQGMRKVEPTEDDLRWRRGEEVRAFEMADMSDRFRTLRETLFAEMTVALGPERSELLRQKLYYWMPIDDARHGLSTGLAVIPFAHRVRFYAGAPGSQWLGWSMSNRKGEGVSASIAVEDIAAFFRPHLEDWIAIAQAEPSTGEVRQP